MGRFLMLYVVFLLVILLIGNIINYQVKKILKFNGIQVRNSFLLGILNDLNFYKLIKTQEDKDRRKRYMNLFTVDMFIQILFILLTIGFIMILANDFYRN